MNEYVSAASSGHLVRDASSVQKNLPHASHGTRAKPASANSSTA